MKYIRTKETEYGCIIDTEKYLKETGEEYYIPENEIIKADTIEELCNGFVIVGINNDFYEDDIHKVYQDFIYARHVMVSLEKESRYDRDFAIYGAIWTDKGLIYVAKMNEKGELELI